ncbi:carboxylesterase [Gammaproteobacteria bacterium]
MRKISCLIASIISLFSCYTLAILPEKYYAAKLNSPFKNLSTPIAGNSPFEIAPNNLYPVDTTKKYKRGILLIHGLSCSPYVMRPLGDFFAKNGFYVMAILLPGHGTQPRDLLHTKWEEWSEAVQYGVNALAQKADEIYLAGYSIGGTLAIQTSLNDGRIRGLFLFAPAIEITKWAMTAKIVDKLGIFYPKLHWLNIGEDIDSFKYESVTMNAVYQTYSLIQQLHKKMQNRKITIPIFLVSSQDDTTVDVDATINFFSKCVINKNKHMILYTTQPETNIERIAPTQIELVQSAFPKEKILSSAHTALLTPPNDVHYGVNGNYANCIHYDIASNEYKKCQKQYDFLGEITDKNYKRGIIRRLMYNPNFLKMQASLKQFLQLIS